MTTYRPASEVRRIAEDLIPKYHADLADVRIDYVFRDTAAKSRGQAVWGKARKIGGLNAYLAADEPSDIGDTAEFFVVEIAEDIWAVLDDKQRVALVDHELCHFAIVYDDKADESKLVMRAHDVEEFRDIVERHGLWAPSIEAMAKAMTQQTLDLYGNDEVKLAIKVELDTGGSIILNGEGLSAEDVNEVFKWIASGQTVVSQWTDREHDDG